MRGCDLTTVAVPCLWQHSDSSVLMVGRRMACSVALIQTGLLSQGRIHYSGHGLEGRG